MFRTMLEFIFRDSIVYYTSYIRVVPIPVSARSKAWVYGRSLTGIAGSNPTRGMDVCLL
jgi:hypothetical protein